MTNFSKKRVVSQKSGSGLFGVKGSDIPSATTTNLYSYGGDYNHITGTTAITSLGTAPAGFEKKIVFDNILTLTYNATSLILPGGANITTAAGDSALFVSEGSGNWKCMFYQSAANQIGTWSPSHTGYSVNPSGGTTEYTLDSNGICTVWMYQTSGTSNLTTTTFTLPFAAKYTLAYCPNVVNAGNNATGLINTTAGSNIVNAYATGAGGTWTASGGKRVCLAGFSYRIA